VFIGWALQIEISLAHGQEIMTLIGLLWIWPWIMKIVISLQIVLKIK
jgi:hypothetical protein